MNDAYKNLAKHLNNLPGGFPETENGVEYRILKRLFTQEEAELAVYLNMMPEDVDSIASRAGVDTSEISSILAEMARKGLIFRKSKNGNDLYSAAMFVVGIWEYHLNDLDEDLVRDVNEYLPHIAEKIWMKNKTKHLRVVPISKTILPEMAISSYEDAEKIIKTQTKIVVQPCICRKEHEFIGKKYDYPVEICLSFGTGAYYYEKNNLGRSISVEEALEILDRGLKAGLVLQPGNAQKPTNLCICCGCCCQIIKNGKKMEKPAMHIHSNFFVQVIEDECLACGNCADRCHMDAITINDFAFVNQDRCIVCGVCITDCPSEAIILKQKEAKDIYVPPKNTVETYMKMAQDRGLML
jgi:NAD-dependent dihydropyrimidine dehydrogenase PreA subunit/predicted transcriptional regulator